MKKPRYISVDKFSDKYDICNSHIFVAIGSENVPRFVIKKISKGLALVDENYFIRRNRFKSKVKNYNHDMYYVLAQFYSSSEISRMIGVSIPFVTNCMWKIDDGSVFTYRLSQGQWKMFKWLRRIERLIYKYHNIKFNITKLLDEGIELKEEAKHKRPTHQTSDKECADMVAEWLKTNKPSVRMKKNEKIPHSISKTFGAEDYFPKTMDKDEKGRI